MLLQSLLGMYQLLPWFRVARFLAGFLDFRF